MISQDDARNSGEYVLSAHGHADYEAGFLVHDFCAIAACAAADKRGISLIRIPPIIYTRKIVQFFRQFRCQIC